MESYVKRSAKNSRRSIRKPLPSLPKSNPSHAQKLEIGQPPYLHSIPKITRAKCWLVLAVR